MPYCSTHCKLGLQGETPCLSEGYDTSLGEAMKSAIDKLEFSYFLMNFSSVVGTSSSALK